MDNKWKEQVSHSDPEVAYYQKTDIAQKIFRQPSAVTCTALPSECARPSGFFCRWPEGLECTSRRSPGSYAQQWQFPLDTQDIPIHWTLTACSTLEADAAMRYRNLRLTLTLEQNWDDKVKCLQRKRNCLWGNESVTKEENNEMLWSRDTNADSVRLKIRSLWNVDKKKNGKDQVAW